LSPPKIRIDPRCRKRYLQLCREQGSRSILEAPWALTGGFAVLHSSDISHTHAYLSPLRKLACCLRGVGDSVSRPAKSFCNKHLHQPNSTAPPAHLR
jgi:hypothetical protein